MPYQIIFYEKSNGKSDVWDFLEQLHFATSFSEKEQKTPQLEIEKAKAERKDYLSRKESV